MESVRKCVSLVFGAALDQAESTFQQHGNTRINDSVQNAVPVPTRAEDVSINKPLQLIGHCLRLHPDSISKISDTHFAIPNQGMQQTQSRVIGKDLEQPHQRRGLSLRKQFSFSDNRLRREDRQRQL
jgi:hypothetical protein